MAYTAAPVGDKKLCVFSDLRSPSALEKFDCLLEKLVNERIEVNFFGPEWVSENEEPQDDVGYIIISKEQSDCFEEDEREAMIKYRKKKEKEKRQLSRENMKEALAKPLKPLPKKELCQYERIRAQIIAEREEYMRKSNFYNDLEKAKKDIG